MKFNFPINNFTAGEWTPKMSTRTDVQEITRSCETLTNYLPQIHGGVQYRGGLQSMILSDVDQAILNTAANPGGGYSLLPNGVRIIPYKNSVHSRSGLLYIQQTSPAKWLVIRGNGVLGTTSNVTDLSSSIMANWVPEHIQYVQLGDILIFTNITSNYEPAVFYYNIPSGAYELSTFSAYANTFGGKAPWESQPYGVLNALGTAQTLTVPAVTNTIGTSFTLTASAPLFVSTDVGRYIRLGNGTAKDGIVRITAYLTPLTVTAIIEYPLPNTNFTYGSSANANSFWLTTEWSNTTGYPKVVTVFQGRTIFGGTKAKKDTLYGSRISSYFDFLEIPYANTTGVSGFASSAFTSDNSRPFTLTPNTPESSAIVALSAGKTLTAHTESSEIVIYGSSGALGPLSVVMESNSTFGASGKVQPRRVNNFSTFVQRNGYKLRDLTYSFDQAQYVSADLSFMAEHFFNNDGTFSVDEIVGLEKLEQRGSYLYTMTEKGAGYVMAIDRDYKINAWARLTLGGTDAALISLCPFIGFSDSIDPMEYMYALVKRRVGSTYVLDLTCLTIPWEYTAPTLDQLNPLSSFNTPMYLDFGIDASPNYPGGGSIGAKTEHWSATSIARPLLGYPRVESPFKSQEVDVIADGNYLGKITTDANGDFTLSQQYYKVQVGFKYQGVIVPAPMEQGGQVGIPVGRQKRADEIVIFFHRSMGTKYGKSMADLIEIPMRDPAQPMGTPVEYFTGEKVIQMLPGYQRAYKIIIVQDKPYPSYIKAVSARGVTYD